MQKKQRYLLWVIGVVCAAVLGAVVLGGPDDAGGPPGHTQPQLRPQQTAPPQTVPTLPPETTLPEESSEPTETTEPEQEPDWEQTEPPETTEPTQPPEPPPQEPEYVADGELLCRQYARFSGQYVEDGRDELVENVAAILVTNKSDRFLDLASLAYDIDGVTAVFVVTGLPAGRSAWVMESTGMVIPDDAVFTFVETVTSFRDDVTAQTEAISLYADANMLTAVNNTDEVLEDVFVYYKTVHTDGNFFGGITYRVDFGTLEPGASAQTLAGHYSSNAEIVRIGWADQ